MTISRHARGSNKKTGTTNKKQVKARDKSLAKKAAAAARDTAEAMADLAEPEYDSGDEQPERVRDAAQEERRRQAIVMKFVQLGSRRPWRRGPGLMEHSPSSASGLACIATRMSGRSERCS